MLVTGYEQGVVGGGLGRNGDEQQCGEKNCIWFQMLGL